MWSAGEDLEGELNLIQLPTFPGFSGPEAWREFCLVVHDLNESTYLMNSWTPVAVCSVIIYPNLTPILLSKYTSFPCCRIYFDYWIISKHNWTRDIVQFMFTMR